MAKRHGRDLPPSPVGRPDKFTPARRAAIIDSIANKIPYVLAAEANGICESTLYSWLDTGRKDQQAGIPSDYADFFEAIKSTEQEKIKKLLDVIEKNHKRWQATAWILERRWWKLFSSSAAVIEFNRKLDQMEQEGAQKNVETLKREAQEIT